MIRSVKTGLILIVAIASLMWSCNNEKQNVTEGEIRIVSLKGSFSETISALGFEENIVGVDITSTYPSTLLEKPKMGHRKNMSVEGVLSLDPTHIFADPDDLKPETVEQLKKTSASLILYKQDYSLEGTRNMIGMIADTLGAPEKANEIMESIQSKLTEVDSMAEPVRALFIYARGAGTILVAGTGTQMAAAIEMAGGINTAAEISDFKPLTSEALLDFDPEVIIMFNRGLKSLKGMEGLYGIPGISNTIAGKNERIITMDAQFLSGFGPRLGEAIVELNKEFKKIRVTE